MNVKVRINGRERSSMQQCESLIVNEMCGALVDRLRVLIEWRSVAAPTPSTAQLTH